MKKGKAMRTRIVNKEKNAMVEAWIDGEGMKHVHFKYKDMKSAEAIEDLISDQTNPLTQRFFEVAGPEWGP